MSSSSQTSVLSRQHVSALRPDARFLEELKNFPFVDNATIANLATELPLDLAAADGVMCDSEEEKLVW